ncbi:hypothetical protein Sjap_010197 [Stephania japonica]|uniref:Uncharacterized protein n=1 Tax=Stephania japonica TaxID=461633 RepID=A0AAP0J9X7_9MAGN
MWRMSHRRRQSEISTNSDVKLNAANLPFQSRLKQSPYGPSIKRLNDASKLRLEEHKSLHKFLLNQIGETRRDYARYGNWNREKWTEKRRLNCGWSGAEDDGFERSKVAYIGLTISADTALLFALVLLLVVLYVQGLEPEDVQLSQQWPGSKCGGERGCCYPKTGKAATGFVIHGLRAENLVNKVSKNCDSKDQLNPSSVGGLLLGGGLKRSPFLPCPWYTPAKNSTSNTCPPFIGPKPKTVTIPD